MGTEDILKARGEAYGDYRTLSSIAQRFKEIIYSQHNRLSPVQAESLDLIATKIARILSGDPNLVDNWDDIAGYAELVSRSLKERAP